MDILHRATDPPLLKRLQKMLAASQRARFAIGSGFAEMAGQPVGANQARSV